MRTTSEADAASAASSQATPVKGGRVLPAFCNVLGVLMLVAVIGLCAPLTLPLLAGYHVYDVVSGSMEPELPVGSAVYVKDTDLSEIQEGEIIAYQDGESIIVHRVVTNRTSLGEFVTKGDANAVEDFEPIPYEAVVGRMEMSVPVLGAFMSIYASVAGKVYLLLTAACGVMLNMVASRMRESRRAKELESKLAAARAGAGAGAAGRVGQDVTAGAGMASGMGVDAVSGMGAGAASGMGAGMGMVSGAGMASASGANMGAASGMGMGAGAASGMGMVSGAGGFGEGRSAASSQAAGMASASGMGVGQGMGANASVGQGLGAASALGAGANASAGQGLGAASASSVGAASASGAGKAAGYSRASGNYARGRASDAKPSSRRSGRLGSIVRGTLVALLAVAFLGSAGVIGYVNWQYAVSDSLYGDATDKYLEGDANADEGDANAVKPPIQIDFDSLRAKNPDVIGWIYCPGTVINYPVLQGKTNDDYLHHDYTGDYNINGSIFVDSGNGNNASSNAADGAEGEAAGEAADGAASPPRYEFTDSNTIIYGHHMNSGSMFASLEKWADQAYYKDHPIMWLLTPTQDYKIVLFSGHHVNAYSTMYQIIHTAGEELGALLGEALAESNFHANAQLDSTATRLATMKGVDLSQVQVDESAPFVLLDSESHYVMLSTCAYLFDNDRYVLHGKLVPVNSVGGKVK